jgi:hypothetical protein
MMRIFVSSKMEMLGSNLGRVIGYPESFGCFPQPLHIFAGLLSHPGHDRFLPNPSGFIIYKSS